MESWWKGGLRCEGCGNGKGGEGGEKRKRHFKEIGHRGRKCWVAGSPVGFAAGEPSSPSSQHLCYQAFLNVKKPFNGRVLNDKPYICE